LIIVVLPWLVAGLSHDQGEIMRQIFSIVILAVVCLFSGLANGFVVPTGARQLGQSSFALRSTAAATPADLPANKRRGNMSMMGKIAKFGIFSPAVIVAKLALGEPKLNKIRGKAIALHSQAITEFCTFVGAQGKMRARIIKKAKTNGDNLGFLW